MESSNEHDARLLGGAFSGDRRCIELLVLKYQNLAYAVAFRIVDNREDAEEVVQDSFSRAFRSLDRFNQLSKFSTWLYRIVYNAAISKRRGRPLAFVPIDEQTEARLDPSQAERNPSFGHADARQHLHAALARLVEEDQVILALHYLADKSVDDVGEILSVKRSAVKMRLMRARQRLLHELTQLLGSEIKDIL
jgi:RNA polymerase sigma-70 factor (ECF subfamily)